MSPAKTSCDKRHNWFLFIMQFTFACTYFPNQSVFLACRPKMKYNR